MKKKTLVFHPIIAPYRIDLFNAISEHYDARFILYWRNLKDQTFDYAKIEEQMSFKPVYYIKEEMGTWRWLKTMWGEIYSSKPDCVLVPELGVLTIMTIIHRMLTFGKYKIVCMTDDSYNILSDDNHFTKRHKKAINIMAPFIDEFINVEPRSAKWYQQRFGKGLYFPIIAEDNAARERLKRVLPISEQYINQYGLQGKKILLFVGRLVDFKNIDFAIKAFVKANIKDSVFVIIGSGNKEGELKNLAAKYGNVYLAGRFEGDELYAWYNVGQVFTLPSRLEPFGAVTNEALVAGCQCLISCNAGSNCLVNNGVNGYDIDPRDENVFIHYLSLLMDEVSPIRLPLSVRPTLMISTFKEEVKKLFDRIDALI